MYVSWDGYSEGGVNGRMTYRGEELCMWIRENMSTYVILKVVEEAMGEGCKV